MNFNDLTKRCYEVALFQSCLSKLNTIALGVRSQFSSVKLRESKAAGSTYVKFIYSEKAIKFCEIFTLLLTGTT